VVAVVMSEVREGEASIVDEISALLEDVGKDSTIDWGRGINVAEPDSFLLSFLLDFRPSDHDFIVWGRIKGGGNIGDQK
jgi:hypothetical protein